MSIYAYAMNTLHGLDVMFDSLQREFILGKKRIIAPARAMRQVNNPSGGPPQKYFDADDEVWEALSTDNPEDLKIYDNSVDLRINEHITGINGDLSILCAQVGFDPGILSFDAQKGMKTAREVISENSKTFGTVKAHENAIKTALTDMARAVIDLAVRYGLTWEGQSVESLAKPGFDVAVAFDDSIIQDKEADLSQGIMKINSGVMSKRKFMLDVLGYTPEEADAEIQQIKAEGAMNASSVTSLFGNLE